MRCVRHDARWMCEEGTKIPPGQAEAHAILAECYELIEKVLDRSEIEDETHSINRIYNTLVSIANEIQILKNQGHWSTKQVRPIQDKLRAIDRTTGRSFILIAVLSKVTSPSSNSISPTILWFTTLPAPEA